MSAELFRGHYAGLTDDELLRVLDDRKDLVPEATAALDLEIGSRHLAPSEPQHWVKTPESSEPVHSLEDYEEYRQLLKKKLTLGRIWHVVALAPFVLCLIFARRAVDNSMALLFLTLGWALCVVGYMLVLNLRFLGFRCPQCSQSFGRGSECFNCGFPRSPRKVKNDA